MSVNLTQSNSVGNLALSRAIETGSPVPTNAAQAAELRNDQDQELGNGARHAAKIITCKECGHLAEQGKMHSGHPIPICVDCKAKADARANEMATACVEAFRPLAVMCPARNVCTDGIVIQDEDAEDMMFNSAIAQLRDNTADSGEESEYFCRCLLQWMRKVGPFTKEAIDKARREVEKCASMVEDAAHVKAFGQASDYELRYAQAIESVASEIAKLEPIGGGN